MPSQMKKRGYAFTHNNYDPATLLTIQALAAVSVVRYFCFGKEVGENGTPHLQGYIYFKSPRTLRGAIDFLQAQMPGCHVEAARGSGEQNRTYCSKDGDFFEEGDCPKDAAAGAARTAEFWRDTRLAASEGRLSDIDEQIRFKNDQCIERHHMRALKTRKLDDSTEKHQWFWGPSGTGKSRRARSENPDAYLKMCNKWWDGYEQEDTVLIEDFDQQHNVLCHHLKIWADRYPFLAEVKGHAMKIRPKKIVVTSNYHPSDIWNSDKDLDPIIRRFQITEFKEFPGAGQPVRRTSPRRNLVRQDAFSGF